MKRRYTQISKISLLHYMKLMLRSLLLVAALICYIRGKASILKNSYVLPMVVWIFFFVEMILRFFPSKLESMGCQKQFRKNYSAVEGAKPVNISWKRTALVAVSWLALNAVIGLMYYEEPVLYYLQNLQLGFCHDVHTARVHSGHLYIQFVGMCIIAVAAVGDYLSMSSGALFRYNQQMLTLHEL